MKLADNAVDDALIVALFPQIAWKFLENRNNPAAFEPAPTGNESTIENKPVSKAASAASGSTVYTVELEGKAFVGESKRKAAISLMSRLLLRKPRHKQLLLQQLVAHR